MQNIEIDFYTGFEYDEEIEFFVKTDLYIKKIRIWIGYFSIILGEIEEIKRPSDNPWTGLVYYYNLLFQWDEGKNWQIPCLEDVLLQLKSMEISPDDPANHINYEIERKIVAEMIDILQEAIEGNFPVYINQK